MAGADHVVRTNPTGMYRGSKDQKSREVDVSEARVRPTIPKAHSSRGNRSLLLHRCAMRDMLWRLEANLVRTCYCA